MSVIVRGMEMPENCTRCDYIGLNVAIGCPVMSGTNGRATDCPLIALPDHHGRLVDADALRESVLKWLPHDPCGVEENEHPYETDICVSMLMEIEEAPTIVEKES